MTAEDEATNGTRGTGARGWALLAALLGVLVAGLVVSALIVFGNGTTSGDQGRLSSIFDPPDDVTKDREKVLAAAKTFVERFNTYGPELVEEDCRMPEYEAVGDLMTAKFRKVFAQNVVLAEQTVAQTGIDRVAKVYGLGISAIDADSATVLLGVEVTMTYPSAEDPEERLQLEPQRFRYEASLVLLDGRWVVDDLDDVDDGLSSLATASTEQDLGARGCQAATPSETPSETPSGAPSGDATEGSDTP